MKAYVTALDDHTLHIVVPMDDNTLHLCFDVDKYGCLGQIPRVVDAPFIRRSFHKEIRISDELGLNVRTVAEVAKATEPLLRNLLEKFQ